MVPRPPSGLVARTGAILRALSEHRGGLTLTELAVASGLPLSSTHRLVAALADEGIVRSEPRGRIFLGPLITQSSQEEDIVLSAPLRQLTRELAARVHETVDVAVLEGGALRFVAQTAGADGALRTVSSVGVRFPLHCTGSGKAFLARMERDQAAALLPARLRRHTAQTICSKRALWREVDEVRRCGLGFDREEHHAGISSIATLLDDRRAATVAISLVVPSVRFADREQEYAAALTETSTRWKSAIDGLAASPSRD